MSTPRRGQRSSMVQRSPRRGTFWDDNTLNLTIASGSFSEVALDNGVPADEKKGLTLVRTIVKVDVVQTVIGAGGAIAYGIVMVELDANVAGVVPDPGTVGEEAGWLWKALRVPAFTTDLNDYSQRTVINLDIKAMRKYSGEDMNMLLILQVVEGANAMNFDGYTRTLFKRA